MADVIKSSKSQSFSTHAGANIHAYFQGKEIGSIQAISYSVSREKAALYVMGRPSPIGFSRGKRAIAGALIFLMLDQNALMEAFSGSSFVSGSGQNPMGAEYIKDRSVVSGSTAGSVLANEPGNIFDANISTPWYEDQIPPFDVVISAVNEYGATSYMQLVGLELMNSNGGFSVDDLVLEQQYSFIAQDLIHWRRGKENMIDKVGHKSK